MTTEAQRLYKRLWAQRDRKLHPEKYRERQRLWHQQDRKLHPDKHRERDRLRRQTPQYKQQRKAYVLRRKQADPEAWRARGRLNNKAYRAAHPERVKEQRARWRRDNLEYSKLINRRWVERHPEKVQAARKRRYYKDPDKHRLKARIWYHTHRKTSSAREQRDRDTLSNAYVLAHLNAGRNSRNGRLRVSTDNIDPTVLNKLIELKRLQLKLWRLCHDRRT